MAPLPAQQFKHVCLGGTFDSIHQGHLELLSQSTSLATEKLTVGVTDDSMVSKKTLAELILPTEKRIQQVEQVISKLCKEQGKQLVLNIVAINDPFGPAIIDETISAIVVSRETVAGGTKINDIRKSKGLCPLEIITVELVQETSDKEIDAEEDKVSSSTARIRKLGTLLIEPDRAIHDALPYPPYLIGLTGGIASGKSSISAELAKLGAGIIDSDKVAHTSYEKDSVAYKQIISEFGAEVVDGETRQIDRRKLGEKVFANSAAKKKLESIVWPATRQLVENEITRLSQQEKKQVIIVEAAQLIEANWSSRFHQVWVTFIPEAEAIKRVMDRNHLSAQEAQQRVSSQMSNRDRLSHANVAFCTLWDRSFTHTQILKAWNMLQKRFLRH